ncbi:MAG: WcbI family polysaccharide biosynthesis putative acetyltransferase [Acidibrevibacterium sp.]|uniref:WcbI family polysaccharide biosynthesis putative acetyltransferase n=1 Tax=Acidibrevibacterium sp. TaxID=2606776 RepID=UPI003D029451
MKRIAFLGNCQIDTIYRAYRDYILPFAEEEVRYIEAYQDISESDRDFLIAADVVVAQQFDTKQKTNVEDFDLKAKIHRVPYLAATGIYWPYGGFGHPKDNDYKHIPRYSPYNCERGDLYLNWLLEKNVSPKECVKRYLNEDINKIAKLDRRLEMSLAAIKARDEPCGYGIAAYIRETFQKELLFSTVGHFRRSLALFLINELFGRMEVEPKLIERLNTLYPGNPHGSNDITPIHPQVAEHFGLGFITKNQSYRYSFEGRFTFAEYCTRYVRYEFNDPLIDAMLRHWDGKHAEAVPHFEKALKISPRSDHGHLAFSQSLAALGRHEEALAEAREAVALLEDDPEELPGALENLGNFLLRGGAAAEAESATRRALALVANRPALYRLLAAALDRQGKHQDAEQVINDLATLDPLDHGAPAQLGHSLAARGDMAGAAEAFRRSLAIEPRQAATVGALSHVLWGLGEREEAIKAARESLALDPNDPAMQAHFGNICAEIEDDAASVKAYRRALALAPAYPDMRPTRAEIEQWLANALARREQRLAAARAIGETLMRNGEALLEAGQVAAAAQAFGAALARDDRDPEWHWWLSTALHRLGRYAEAAAAASEAAEIAPDQARYFEQLGHMHAAAGAMAEAEHAFRRASELEPDRVSALVPLSHVLFALGRWRDGITAIAAAIKLSPDDADLYIHLGHLLMNAGEPNAAADAYRQAIIVGRTGPDIDQWLSAALRAMETMA